MKIAFVCHRFYPYIGGVETVVLQLASILAAQGIEVTVLTQTNNKQLAKKEILHNITILRFSVIGFSEVKISPDLFRYLQKNAERYDVIHTQNYHAFPAFCAALTKKTPIVFSPHYHGTGHTNFTRLLHYPYRPLGKFIFSQSDAVLCDSDAEMTLLKKHFPNIRKTTLIPLGIDVQSIRLAKKYNNMSPYILSVGRLEKYKNVMPLIRALQYIPRDVELKIVGDGPAKQELEEIAQQLTLSDRISFLKHVSNEDLHRLLKTAKAYVTMSRMEAYGLSLLEAAAAELGIVASDIPAHRDLIKRFAMKHVAVVNPDATPKDLAHAITQAMVSPSQTGQQLPSWELVTQQTLQVYKNLVH